jgi:uncharacterized protein (TIRG00374 family)
MSFKKLQSRLLIALGLGLGVMLILALLSDAQAVGSSLQQFEWHLLPLIVGLTAVNYVLRWLKWDFYLRYMRMNDGVPPLDSGLLFTAGMVMSVTPGKIGEVFKSYLLKQLNNTPITASAPIVLMERLTDGIAMLLLMGVGLTLYPPARPLFFVLVGLTVTGILLVQYRWLCEQILARIAVLPLGSRLAPRLTTIYESIHQLLGWRILLLTTIISVVSWGCECVAFYFVLVGLGVAETWLLLLQATFIFAASTLFGLVSLLPGGLGTSEVTSAGLLVTLVGMDVAAATAATILIRFATLWFGVGLGIIALAWFVRRHRHLRGIDLSADAAA